MADYNLTRRAAADLEAIAAFTIERFGIDRAKRYRDELKACFAELATNPRLGRRAEQLAPGLRRLEHQSHVVFYRPGKDHVLIVRILHYRMDAERHL